jgi:hypothetical protein
MSLVFVCANSILSRHKKGHSEGVLFLSVSGDTRTLDKPCSFT